MNKAANEFDLIFEHRTQMVSSVKIHYVQSVNANQDLPVMLLIHGFPQNWASWRKVMPALAKKYTLVVPDLRGIGLSDKPAAGYSKRELSADLYGLVASLNKGPAHVVGHDMGGMVAFAYASQFPLRSLTILDIPIPGLANWDKFVADPRLWHFALHQKRDLPESLICGGREALYISTFIYDRAHNPGAISSEDMQEYIAAYSHPGAFRAAMEMYRQFPQDMNDNQSSGKLPRGLKVLALGGDKRWGPLIVEHLSYASDNVEGGSIPNCGHFISEEQPELLVQRLIEFCQ